MSDLYLDNFALQRHIWSLHTRITRNRHKTNPKEPRPRLTKGKSANKPYLDHITTSEKIVALCLAHHRSAHTLQCNPGYKKISQETGLSNRSIISAMDALERAKIIWRYKIMEDGEQKGTQYFFWRDAKEAQALYENEESVLSKRDGLVGFEEFMAQVNMPF